MTIYQKLNKARSIFHAQELKRTEEYRFIQERGKIFLNSFPIKIIKGILLNFNKLFPEIRIVGYSQLSREALIKFSL